MPVRSTWSERYGAKHNWRRVERFPEGVEPPRRVRVYRRADHHILQVWDPAVAKNVSQRVDGDLVTAISRAREIEQRLDESRSTGTHRRRPSHSDLVAKYVADLDRRADAAEIDPATADRYRSALAHYSAFVESAEIATRYKYASHVDAEFALRLRAFLRESRVSGNGRGGAPKRAMQAPQYVEDVVRGMFRWAADPDRGGLLADTFRNPFGTRRRTDRVQTMLHEPDVTVGMAAEFLSACPSDRVPLFALHAMFGVRAAEPCFLFGENILDTWLDVVCLPGLDHWTKGRRDKRLPLIGPLQQLFEGLPAGGLLFRRRGAVDGLVGGATLDDLEKAFASRCHEARAHDARGRRRVRDELLREAGALRYDHVDSEFRKVTRKLDWPREATLKDFRHLFATEMQNAGMPEHYRRYLMGLSPGRSTVLAYTHLNEVREKYEAAVTARYGPVLDALRGRADETAGGGR